MRHTLLFFGLFFVICYTSMGQAVAIDVTVNRLISLQPHGLYEDYRSEASSQSHSLETSFSSADQQTQRASLPENLDNAWALEYWHMLQGLKTATQFKASFLRKRLPIHSNKGEILKLDEDVIPRMKQDLEVAY
ncbi:MAG: hypothetical protein RIG62_31165 [Cyclobacteriaceae bacterium]